MSIEKTKNGLLNDILDDHIKSILSRYDNSKKIVHNPTKGTARETPLIELLEKFVPNWVGVSSGIAFDRAGRQSPQLDIVLYNKNYLPSFFYEQQGFFPIDSILYVIEVKSILNKQELEDTIEKFNKLNSLNKDNRTYINTILFAYESDSKKTDELSRLINNYNDFKICSLINVLATVFKKEIYFYKQDYSKPNILRTSWSGHRECNEIDVVKMMLMQIMNTLYPICIGQYIYKNQRMQHYSNVFIDNNKNILHENYDIEHGNIPSGCIYDFTGNRKVVDYYEIDYAPYDI